MSGIAKTPDDSKGHFMRLDENHRRLSHVRRSRLLDLRVDDAERTVLKWAESLEDFEQAFRLVHDEYLRLGYLAAPQASGMFYGVHHLLPTSATLLLRTGGESVATLTQILDTDLFGLPMDRLYRPELDRLRRRGRKLAELSALATCRRFRWRNFFMLLCRVMYHRAISKKVTDLCIMVNPKHAPFYRTIFLFEDIGPERDYPVLGAPAVALRVDLERIQERLADRYRTFSTEFNVNAFLNFDLDERSLGLDLCNGERRPVPLDRDAIHHFLCREPMSLKDLAPEQRGNVHHLCPQPRRPH